MLEARIHALARLGVENILALTGDAQKEGFAGKAKPVYDLDSVLILWLLRALRGGLEYNLGPKTARTTPFDFFAGAVVNPFKVREPDLMMQFYKLQLKVAAGAQYIITQLGYNLRKLYELKQYMVREGIGHIPVLANVYVPTAKIARLMQAGELAGCVIPDELIQRLEQEKKPQRLERAALMVAAVKDLGFAGAHIGGFGLTHKDFMTILERAAAIGKTGAGGSMNSCFHIQTSSTFCPRAATVSVTAQPAIRSPASSITRHGCSASPRGCIGTLLKTARSARDSSARDFAKAGDQPGKNNSWRHGLWYGLLEPATLYRKATLGCVSCGDCIQDHLNYAGCSMQGCYKELRNGPCGGSRVDGTCEARPDLPCIWNLVYQGTLAMGDDPRKFAHVLVPPRDWCLDRTNALANRFAGLDNLCKRIDLGTPR